MIVFQRGEAPARRRFSRRSLRPAEDAPEAVPITRVTVVDATRHEEPAARHWLHQADGRERGEELIAAALLSVNRALRAYATAQAEPWRGPVVDADALVIRLGFGTGEEVADGEWTDAAEHRARSDRKRGADVNAERWVMATMNARVAQPVAASIALEARAEAESGHPREAALLGQLAIRALLADPPPGLEPDDDADLERIRGMGAALEATADACLTRDPSAEESADSLVAIKLVQRVLRRARERATGSG